MKIRKILLLLLRNWYIYVMTLILFVGGAYFYLKNKFPTYRSEAFILIEQASSSPSRDMLEGFTMRPGVQNLDNQILVLSSFTIVREAMEDLPFEIDVYRRQK